MELMRILGKSKNEIGKIPLPEFWELIRYYNNPKEYLKSQSSEEGTLEDLEKAQRASLKAQAIAREKKQRINN